MDYAPHSRKALAHAGQERVNVLSKRFGHTVMLVHWNGALLECVARFVPEDGLATWSIGEKRDNIGKMPWGWVVLQELADNGDDSGLLLAQEENCKDVFAA